MADVHQSIGRDGNPRILRSFQRQTFHLLRVICAFNRAHLSGRLPSAALGRLVVVGTNGYWTGNFPDEEHAHRFAYENGIELD